MNRWVDILKRPLVSGQLAIGVHVPLPGHELQLSLGKFGVDHREGDAVKREVPGGIPRILPLIRHRDDVGVVQVPPVRIPPEAALWRWRGLSGVAVEPIRHVEVEELLAPDHARERLPLNSSSVLVRDASLDLGVESLGLIAAGAHDGGEVFEGPGLRLARPAESDLSSPPSRDLEEMNDPCLGPLAVGAHRPALAVDQVPVEGILEIAGNRSEPERPVRVGLVLGEQELGPLIDEGVKAPELGVIEGETSVDACDPRASRLSPPAPCISKYELRDDPDGSDVGSPIFDGDLHAPIFDSAAGIFDEDVEIPIFVEEPRIEELVLQLVHASSAVLLDQVRVRECSLRVFVEHLQVGVTRSRVEVPVELLDVLSMVALRVGEPV